MFVATLLCVVESDETARNGNVCATENAKQNEIEIIKFPPYNNNSNNININSNVILIIMQQQNKNENKLTF